MSWPPARSEEDLGLEGAGMGMGDVVQQSGHKGGEAGHGGSRVSTAAEGSDVGGLPTCRLCMEPWIDSGAQSICALIAVLDILREPANIEKEHGVHFNEIVKRFKLPESNIGEAIDYNVDSGYVYTTIDDFHFKSASECLPSVQETYYPRRVLTFQAPTTDLLKQVLDILHEPANIEKEHGVDVAEIMERLRLPASNIWGAMEQLIDMGFIYSTIDDFHFLSAGIE